MTEKTSSSDKSDLTAGSVRDRFLFLWFPMIGGVISVKAIGLSDAYFAGRLGEEALAAISFTVPLVMTLISISIGLSARISSILSRAIGNGADQEEQQEIITGAFAMACLFAITLGIVGFATARLLLSLLGAEGSALDTATGYMRTWFIGLVFLIGPIVANGVFRSLGDGKTPALLMAGVAALNIALNPLFMFGIGPFPDLSVQGAAVATVIARGAAACVSVWLLWRLSLIRPDTSLVIRGLRRWREVLRIGLPAAASTSVNPVALAIATAAVATVGESSVAAFGAATKIQSLAVTPLLALSAASAPFAGQNSGAGNTTRTQAMLKLTAVISIFWALAAAATLLLAGDILAAVFTESDTVREQIALYLAIVPISYAGYGLVISLSSALNGVGRSFAALAISGGRALILLAPAAWIGVLLMGFDGVAWGFAAANVISGIAACFYVFRGTLSERRASPDS